MLVGIQKGILTSIRKQSQEMQEMMYIKKDHLQPKANGANGKHTARVEWVVHKLGGREFGPVQVTAGELNAADEELSRHRHRDKLRRNATTVNAAHNILRK
jgi:hypothetical protein